MTDRDIGAQLYSLIVDPTLEDQLKIERACEKALVGGVSGVLVIYDPKTGRVHNAGPSYDVPYGCMHVYPKGKRTG